MSPPAPPTEDTEIDDAADDGDPACLPWPRVAEDGTPLGIDLKAKAHDIERLVLSGFGRSATAAGIDPRDLVQAVALAIWRRNRMPCAFDSRRASFGHYVWRVARSQLVNLLEAERRHHGNESVERDDQRPRDVADDRLNAAERYDAAEQANPPPLPLWRIALDARAIRGPQLDLFGPSTMDVAHAEVEPAPEPPPCPVPPASAPRVRRATPRKDASPGLFREVA